MISKVPTRLSKVALGIFGVAALRGGTDLVDAEEVLYVLRQTASGVRKVRKIHLPLTIGLGEVLTPDRSRLLVANSADGAEVVNVAKAEAGQPGAIAGRLAAVKGKNFHDLGAIEVAVTPSGRLAFVSLEGVRKVAVFNLTKPLKDSFVGDIPTEVAPVGLAVSPNGRWLYATSEAAPTKAKPNTDRGTLSVVSVSKARTNPRKSVVATVDAGCEPVRVVTSADGSVVWVTARASDALLAFSASRLVSAPRKALIADVKVGEAPVGLALVKGGSRVVVADSNRFGAKGAHADLAVVNVKRALAGLPALVGYLRSGRFPRDMALAPGGSLLVSNYQSGQLETVDVAKLP